MTYTEIMEMVNDKSSKCNDFITKIESYNEKLKYLTSEYNLAIKAHNMQKAVNLAKDMREIQDELNATQAIYNDVSSCSAVQSSHLEQCWDDANIKYNEEIEQIYAQLKASYDTFQGALEMLLSTRKDAHKLALMLLKVAKSEKIDFVSQNQFQRKSCIEFWDRKVKFKLNCLEHKITGPIDL